MYNVREFPKPFGRSFELQWMLDSTPRKTHFNTDLIGYRRSFLDKVIYVHKDRYNKERQRQRTVTLKEWEELQSTRPGTKLLITRSWLQDQFREPCPTCGRR